MNCPLPWQSCSSTMTTSIVVHPASLAKHPQRWTKEEVGAWLLWCAEEYSIEPVPQEKFDLNGKALCLLSRNDFIERLPTNGDVLYNCLQTLISRNTDPDETATSGAVSSGSSLFTGGSILYQPQVSVTSSEQRSPTIELQPDQGPICTEKQDPMPAGLLLLPSASPAQSSLTSCATFPGRSYVPIRPHPVFSSSVCDTTALYSATKDCRLLWEFIYQLLINTKYREYVSWENRDDYVFRIVNPTGLAELWGQQKNRTNMTYEKLSRALRYYYRMNIIKKVPGKRLTYRFLQSPSRIQKGQRGAKPHCKYPVSYKCPVSTPSGQAPSSVEQTTREYHDDRSASSDMKDSSSDMNDDIGRDSSEDREFKTWDVLNKLESGKHFTSEFELLRVNKDLKVRQFESHTKFDPRAFFSLPITCSAETHLYNLPSSSSAFRPIHQSYDNPFLLQDIKVEKTDSTLAPSFSAPSTGSTNFITSPGTQDGQIMTSSSMPVNPAFRLQDSFHRSLSEDCAQTLHTSGYLFRPHHTRSASPRTDVQLEPEDLSVKKSTTSIKSTDVH